MQGEEVFLIISVMLILSVTGTLIFRPITTRLGLFLEAVAKTRMAKVERGDDDVLTLLVALDDLQDRLDRIDRRLARIEGVPLLDEGPTRRAMDARERRLEVMAARLKGPHSDGQA